MALKLNSKVIVPEEPPDPGNNTDENSENVSNFRKHLYNQSV